MRKVRTFSGIDRSGFAALRRDREVIVWGGNGACVEVISALKGLYGVASGKAVAVNTRGLSGFDGFAAFTPEEFSRTAAPAPETALIVVASVGFRREIIQQIEQAGFVSEKDYLLHTAIQRRKVFFRLENQAWAAGPTSAQSHIDLPAIALFLEAHDQALQGATCEISAPGCIAGYPGIHELADMLRRHGPLTLSTWVPDPGLLPLLGHDNVRVRLNCFSHIEAGDLYFPGFSSDLDETSYPAQVVALTRLAGNTPWVRGQIELVRQNFNHCGYTRAVNFAGLAAGVSFFSETPHPDDYADLLHLAGGRRPELASRLRQVSGFDLDLALERADQQASERCMCERIFPVLDARGRLLACHLHSRGVLLKKPHAIATATLEQRRETNRYCALCQAHGLHRFDAGLLKMPHPK